MKYIKIVRPENGKLYSMSVTRPDWIVEYIPNQLVQSNNDWGLLVFEPKSKESIKSLSEVAGIMGLQIWFCEAEGIMELPKYSSHRIHGDNEHYYRTESEYFIPWPEGTVMARKVKLTKRIFSPIEGK